MSILYLVLALLFSLLIAVVAMVNSEAVAVNYLLGQANVSLIVLILASASGGALTVGSLSLFSGIQTHLKFRGLRHHQTELQNRLEFLEKEKTRLESQLGRQQSEREAATENNNAEESLPDGEDKANRLHTSPQSDTSSSMRKE